jgi:general secretion pathway protein G
MEDHSRGSALNRLRRGLNGGRVKAFTLIELIIIISIIGILAGIAVPIYADFRLRTQQAVAKSMIREIEAAINLYYYHNQVEGQGAYPNTLDKVMSVLPLDPWGNPYQYLSSQDPGWASKCRRDGMMWPLNRDFDLYSMGADGETDRQITNLKSMDDVVRAGNGSFVDVANLY